MKTQFTPGPWIADAAYSVWQSPDGFLVAHAQGECHEKAEANARAIAALPDLVAALENALDWTDSRDGSQDADETALREIANTARAALAKVKE